MNSRSILLITFLLAVAGASAQTQENVLSYYAVGNSLDGQPMVDMANAIRFYPVFALRERTDSVHVTVYIGTDKPYTRSADRYDGGRYWQALLPQFHLGRAIQRIEVETWISFRGDPLLAEYDNMIDTLHRTLAALREAVKGDASTLQRALAGPVTDLTQRMTELNADLDRMPEAAVAGLASPPGTKLTEEIGDIRSFLCVGEKICRRLETSCYCAEPSLRDDLRKVVEQLQDAARSNRTGVPMPSAPPVMLTCDDMAGIAATLNTRFKALRDDATLSIRQFGGAVRDTIDTILLAALRSADTLVIRLVAMRDSLRDRIVAEHSEMLRDTLFIGPGVRRSDIIMSDNLTGARILYRNYKTSLRSMPALDPAETMGIFRLRYIPFAVTGSRYMATFTGDNSAVFEVGLGFGDVAMSGDDFVRPELSIRRLGIAFAITRKLFESDADVRALVLTYDFNSYGSIGIGANFRRTVVESYFSLGINKQAFEDLLVGISTIFE